MRELTFTDIGLALTGTIDRVRRTDSGLGIADIKTGKSAVAADGTVKTYGYAIQLAVYEILASSALNQPMTAPAQIIGLQVAKTDKGLRAAIGEIKARASYFWMMKAALAICAMPRKSSIAETFTAIRSLIFVA